MTNTLNLKYSKMDLGFFSGIAVVNKVMQEFKGEDSLAVFNIDHETEIGRGLSYALFPELRRDVIDGGQVTIESFRRALTTRGVSDIDFQNKVLCMILQNKAGIQFPLIGIIDILFHDNGHQLVRNASYELSLEVNSEYDLTLVFKGTWDLYNTEPKEPAISVSASVNITPDMVAITDFNMTKISDSPEANAAYNFLENNQQNILEKILSYIKRFFGFNSELRLEETNDGDVSWTDGSK